LIDVAQVTKGCTNASLIANALSKSQVLLMIRDRLFVLTLGAINAA
jgi:hypothetical protein